MLLEITTRRPLLCPDAAVYSFVLPIQETSNQLKSRDTCVENRFNLEARLTSVVSLTRDTAWPCGLGGTDAMASALDIAGPSTWPAGNGFRGVFMSLENLGGEEEEDSSPPYESVWLRGAPKNNSVRRLEGVGMGGGVGASGSVSRSRAGTPGFWAGSASRG